MIRSRPLVAATWLLLVAVAAVVVARARYSADLSAFLPRSPSSAQQLLVGQLQNGLASRLLLLAIEGGDAPGRAAASQALAARLRASGAFANVSNGAAQGAARDQAFLFDHRYLLSSAVRPERFTVEGLRAAIGAQLELLASPAGGLSTGLLARDPTGETIQVIDQLAGGAEPARTDGVWSSRDGERALLLAATRAAGSDTDAQARAIALIRTQFGALVPAGPGAPRLIVSGPGVFAVEARARIEHEALRLSLLSGALIVTLLLLVYRSVTTLLLGLLPVLSGALAGIAAVALGFGVVHGITLGFGITLIGESVDYSVYLLLQSRPADRGAGGGQALRIPAALWPTMGLGVLTSICGFASLLPSAFPGLSQLGLYSISGLIAAAAVTRWVLPALLPANLPLRDLSPLGRALTRAVRMASLPPLLFAAVGVACALVLALHRETLWNRELSALSPVSARELALDAQLRRELGAPDVSNLVIVAADTDEGLLERVEQVGARLDELVARGVIAGYDSPARYLPSRALQLARRASLPAEPVLRERLRAASATLEVRPDALEPFLRDVAAARTGPLVDRSALAGSSLALALDGMLAHEGRQVQALLPLQAAGGAGIDTARVRAALAGFEPGSIVVLNVGQETAALYGSYLREALRLSLLGFAAIVILLALVLRSAVRVARVIAPLLLAVLTVSAALALLGMQLTILHLIGLLLIVAVGSNYALFFDRSAAPGGAEVEALPRTLASLLIANASTVIGFGALAFSSVPVLQALGMTVAPGAALALVYSGLLAPRAAAGPAVSG